jgi:hypothetical protein
MNDRGLRCQLPAIPTVEIKLRENSSPWIYKAKALKR